AGVVALVLNLATGMPLELAFVVGAIVSATDPAAVIATFRRLHSPIRLATLVEAESLFNDGTAIVVFLLALAAIGRPVTPAELAAAGGPRHRVGVRGLPAQRAGLPAGRLRALHRRAHERLAADRLGRARDPRRSRDRRLSAARNPCPPRPRRERRPGDPHGVV